MALPYRCLLRRRAGRCGRGSGGVAACDNGAAMATTVVCSRCDEEKPALDAAPMGGAMGARVLEHVCADCWAEWREASPRVINHYGLRLGNPEQRAQARAAMLEFVGPGEEEAER